MPRFSVQVVDSRPTPVIHFFYGSRHQLLDWLKALPTGTKAGHVLGQAVAFKDPITGLRQILRAAGQRIPAPSSRSIYGGQSG